MAPTPEQRRQKAEYQRKLVKRLRKERRLFALAHFGGKCVKCGFDDERALQFDHINGGGSGHLKKRGMLSSYYLEAVRAPAGTYQLLCANCNWIKRTEKDEGGKAGAKTSISTSRFWQEVRDGTKPAPVHKRTS